MEDNDIRQLFREFEPPLGDSSIFMKHVLRDIEAIDRVKEYGVAMKRRDRRSILFAAVAGFVSGAFFTWFYPVLCSIVDDLITSLAPTQVNDNVTAVIACMLTAATSLAAVLFTYNFSRE